jgi:hypothetical protein
MNIIHRFIRRRRLAKAIRRGHTRRLDGLILGRLSFFSSGRVGTLYTDYSEVTREVRRQIWTKARSTN